MGDQAQTPKQQTEAKIERELAQGQAALARGNAGMARVCARRAAGWAAEFFLNERELVDSGRTGYEKLCYLRDSTLLGETLRERLANLTRSLEKDDPDGESYWPLDVDLLDEARAVVRALLDEPTKRSG